MKFRFISLYLITIFTVFGIISIQKTHASSPSSILVDVVPSSPAPFEDTNITLSSYADNLDIALIKWSVGGKSVLSGIGKKSFSLKAPSAGSETAVVATVSLPDGDIETNIIIRPSVMVLLWQATDSYVPPFYKGKALPTPDSQIKVVAMPEIRVGSGLIDSKNMNYDWNKDYNNVQQGSGYGNNSFTYISDYLDNTNNIGVTASTIDQKYSSQASIDIGMTQPKIVFYKNDNNLGTIWEKALTDPYKIQGPEIVEAIPYFISPKEMQNPRLVWNWSINDAPVDISGSKKNLIPLQAESGVSGTSKLKLEIGNMDKVFETANKEINIEF